MATGGVKKQIYYPIVRVAPQDKLPYYKLGETVYQLNCDAGSLHYICQKPQSNLTMYQLTKCIESGADINENINGWSPLDVAYFNQNFLTLRVLLANCALVCNLASPLHLAIATGCLEEVMRHLSKVHGLDLSKLPSLVDEISGADGNAWDELTKSRLGEHIEGVAEEFAVDEANLDKGLKKDTAIEVQKMVQYKFRYTPEMKRKAQANAEFLLFDMRNFEIDAKDCNCDTPLHLSCRVGYTGLSEILIKCGSDVNLCNMMGYPPLMYACVSRNPDLVALLIKLGAKVQQCYRGQDGVLHGPFLHAVVGKGKESSKCIELLIEHGIDVHVGDQDGYTALHHAARYGDVDCIRVLMTHGANPNIAEPFIGRTALYLACNAHHSDAVKYMIENGANMEHKDRLTETPIVALLQYIDDVKDINPFYAYFARSVYTISRIAQTLQVLINHGCRLPFFDNPELMLRVYCRAREIFRYAMSSASCLTANRHLNRQIVVEICSENDTETIMSLRSAGYDLNNEVSLMNCALLTALYEPLPLTSLCRLIIRQRVCTKYLQEQSGSKLKQFFKKLSLKPEPPKSVPLLRFDSLPLPKELKSYLCFQDMVDSTVDNDRSYLASSAVGFHDQMEKQKSDTGKLEKMLVDEAMLELGEETRDILKSYHQAEKKFIMGLRL